MDDDVKPTGKGRTGKRGKEPRQPGPINTVAEGVVTCAAHVSPCKAGKSSCFREYQTLA